MTIENPKAAVARGKLPLHLVPATSLAWQALAHLDGGLKYGYQNYRASGIVASDYVSAAQRHIQKWFNGEDRDSDSGLMHLAHAIATLNIIIDAAACGKLTDDRAPACDIGAYFDKLTPHVARLKLLHAGKNPKHYTVADSQPIAGQRTLDDAVTELPSPVVTQQSFPVRVEAGNDGMDAYWTIDGMTCVPWVKRYRTDHNATLKAAKDEWDRQVDEAEQLLKKVTPYHTWSGRSDANLGTPPWGGAVVSSGRN
jgi:hypothetical protein